MHIPKPLNDKTQLKYCFGILKKSVCEYSGFGYNKGVIKMKKIVRVIPFVFLLFIVYSCQQSERALLEPKVDVEADIQAIKDIVSDINAAVNAADIERLVSFCADDMVRIFPNVPPLIGKEAYRSRFQEIFDQFNLQEEDVVENVIVSGDLAIAHVIFSVIVTPKADGEPVQPKLNGNWLLALKRQPDNAWKVIYSMSSDERLVYPTQVE